MASFKKRKVDSEGIVYQEERTDYFFVLIKDSPVCLVCKASVVVMK
jgi:hypothetical protein